MSKWTSSWVLAALLAAAIEPILAKLGYRGDATPLQLLVMKNVVAACMILPLTRAWNWIGWRRRVCRLAERTAERSSSVRR